MIHCDKALRANRPYNFAQMRYTSYNSDKVRIAT
jgi:hypothetical protein